MGKFRDRPYLTRRPIFWVIVLAVILFIATLIATCAKIK